MAPVHFLNGLNLLDSVSWVPNRRALPVAFRLEMPARVAAAVVAERREAERPRRRDPALALARGGQFLQAFGIVPGRVMDRYGKRGSLGRLRGGRHYRQSVKAA